MQTLNTVHLSGRKTTIVALSLILSACSAPAEDPGSLSSTRPVRLYEVDDQQHLNQRSFPARLKASEEASLSFRIPGELVDFPVLSGTLVNKGQVLARLDGRDSKNQLAARQADFELADADYLRISALRERQMVSQADYDQVRTRRTAARVAVNLAQDQLNDTVMKAPFSGRIARRHVENYQSVEDQQPVLDLQNHKRLDVTIQMPESLLTRLRQGQIESSYQPVIHFAHDPQATYLASYREHATQVTPGTQSYEVSFSMPAPDDFVLYPGMAATLVLDMSQLRPDDGQAEYIVPITAVAKDDASSQYQAWVYESGTLQPRNVTLGQLTENGITITSGLKPGEQIASAGLNQLRPGMAVTPLQRERGI